MVRTVERKNVPEKKMKLQDKKKIVNGMGGGRLLVPGLRSWKELPQGCRWIRGV